jgi:hypothetical protein
MNYLLVKTASVQSKTHLSNIAFNGNSHGLQTRHIYYLWL